MRLPAKWILAPLLLCMLCTTARAHVSLTTKYHLHLATDRSWELTIQLKTSAIQEQISSLYPELEGQDMNSETFKAKTWDYLLSCLQVRMGEQGLELQPKRLSFGGHQGEGALEVRGMPAHPASIDFHITCFTDADDHAANEITVDADGEMLTFQLGEGRQDIRFEFARREFVEVEGGGGGMSIGWMIMGLVVVGMVIILQILKSRRRGRNGQEAAS